VKRGAGIANFVLVLSYILFVGRGRNAERERT
jgi:hypothetical protein